MSLDINTVQTVSLIVIGVLVLLAILFAAIITKMITKLVMITAVLVLAGLVWWQRDQLTECAQTCQCTFFGQEVILPESEFTQCAQ